MIICHFFSFLFVNIHFTHVVLKESLELVLHNKMKRQIEYFNPLVIYGIYAF